MIAALQAAVVAHLVAQKGVSTYPAHIAQHNGELAEEKLPRVHTVPALYVDLDSGVFAMQSQNTSENEHSVEVFAVCQNEQNDAAPTAYATLLDWIISNCRGKILTVSGVPVRLGERFEYQRIATGRLWVGVVKISIKEAGL